MLCLALMKARMSESVWLSPVRGTDDTGLSGMLSSGGLLGPLCSPLGRRGPGEGRIFLVYTSLQKTNGQEEKVWEEVYRRGNSGFMLSS